MSLPQDNLFKRSTLQMDKFGIVAKAVMTQPGLSFEAKAVYALLACYANTERTCFPSTALLARQLGKSTATIYRLLAELEKAKVINKTRQGRRRIIMLRDQTHCTTTLISSGE